MRSVGELGGLTGLRGLAALVVFIAHSRYQDLLPSIGAVAEWLQWHDQAVDLFFIMSGWVMMHVYAGKLGNTGTVTWKSYAIARLARVVPLYLMTFLTALVIFCLGSLVLKKWPQNLTPSVISTNLLLVQNWPGLFRMSINLPSWSLSVEMFCYLVGIVPALWLHRLVKLKPMLAWTVVSLLMACRLSFHGETFAWTSLWRGMIGFLMGAALPAPRASGVKTVLASVLLFVFLRSMATWAGWNPTWAELAFPTLIWGLSSPTRSWFENKWMLCLGDLSYSIYLWHGPMMLITYYQVRPRISGMPLAVKVLWAVTEITLLLVISALSYKHLEMPARKWVRSKLGK